MIDDDVKQLYRSDPEFHALVSAIYSMICNAQITPLQVKQAAVYACILYAETHSSPLAFNLQAEKEAK